MVQNVLIPPKGMGHITLKAPGRSNIIAAFIRICWVMLLIDDKSRPIHARDREMALP
jgi:hypothetical protein